MDCAYLEEFSWTYDNLPESGINKNLYNYNGPGPCLRPYVVAIFLTILEACGVAGDVTYKLLKGITAYPNAYTPKNMSGSKFSGRMWHPITIEEMYPFWVSF